MNIDFQIKILLLSFVASVCLSFFIIPILRKLKVGQNERDDGPQSHIKKQGTPTMGGIIMIISIIVCSIGGYFYYRGKELQIAQNIIPLLLVTIGFGLVGFIDDFKKIILKNTKGLSPVLKMLGQLIIATGFAIYITNVLNLGTDIIIPFANTEFVLPMVLYIPFIILVMLGTTNAVNLTDGVDGLATSTSAIILTTLTIIGIVLDVKEVVIFGSICVGSCLGFLIFNLHKAKVFMGDLGSLMLGGAISAIAIYLKMPLLLVVIALVPVIETISVMAQVIAYKTTGKRILKMAPLHHHFELSGWRENKIVSVFCIVTVFVCVIGLYSI
ncbi:MAG: phospho-N-acetylmuramoyl-pentapeptide-transferase [Clostridia bacterium]|nr:phospho-N-acetylmuramoyl-pentapeptide-transferase [Clostridia bacterium]